MGDRPITAEQLTQQRERDAQSAKDVVSAVCMKRDGRCVGTTGLYGIHWIMRAAEFRIFLGDRRVWNQGIGTEVTRSCFTNRTITAEAQNGHRDTEICCRELLCVSVGFCVSVVSEDL